MTAKHTKHFVLAIALAAAAAGAQAAGQSLAGASDPYIGGARSVQEPRSPYSDGARTVDLYTDGARNVDPDDDGSRVLAGLDRTGVSADPARQAAPRVDSAAA